MAENTKNPVGCVVYTILGIILIPPAIFLIVGLTKELGIRIPLTILAIAGGLIGVLKIVKLHFHSWGTFFYGSSYPPFLDWLSER